jgi:hypothetical protein
LRSCSCARSAPIWPGRPTVRRTSDMRDA